MMTNGRFTLPDGHALATAEMQFGDDLPLIFAHTQIRQMPGARISTTELRDALRAFTLLRDSDPKAIHDGDIRRVADVAQTRFGATRRKTNGKPFYEGVALVAHEDPEIGPEEVDLAEI